MIIYYSGTGNSRFIAEAAADFLADELTDTRPYIKSQQAGAFTSTTPYVFCSPTYAWRLPLVFSRFIEKSQFSGSKEAWFIMSCGDDVGNASAYIQKLCQKKSLHFKGLLPVVMPENYLALFSVPEPLEARKIIAAALPTLKQGLERIQQSQDFADLPAGLSSQLKSGIINVLFRRFIVKSRSFRSTDACIGCGRCVQSCVQNNIVLKEKRPHWGNDCIHCMACICDCPVQAIEYGTKSVGKVRYRCPDYNGELHVP